MAQQIYIDESGSITREYADAQPYFVISMLHVTEKEKLKRVFKRFVSANLKELKRVDKHGKMFDTVSGKFLELKGCCLDYNLKIKFIGYFTRSKIFEVFYIQLDNHHIDPKFELNKARCFNYLVKSSLQYYINHKMLPNDEYFIHIDERNIKTEAKYTLEDYLNTELVFGKVLNNNVKVAYYDSCNSILIQIADVFANIFYSNLMCKNYDKQISGLKRKGFIKQIFKFPCYAN